MTKTNLVGLVLCVAVVAMFAVWQTSGRESWCHVNPETIVGGADCYLFVVARCPGAEDSSGCSTLYCSSDEGGEVWSWYCPSTRTIDVSMGEYNAGILAIEAPGLLGWGSNGTEKKFCTVRVTCSGCLNNGSNVWYCQQGTPGTGTLNEKVSYKRGNACGN